MSWDLRDKYAIAGVGQSRLGSVPGCSAIGLFVEAAASAIEDAGIDKSEIDGLITRGPDDVYCHHQRIGQALGLNVNFSTTLDNGGASQCMAVGLACMAIEAGLCKTVLCGYGRDSWSRTRSSSAKMRVALIPEAQQAREFGPEFGFIGAAGMHALGARRHMHEYGTTREQMGAVALAFREHAQRNPLAQMHGQTLNMDQYLSSRWIVEPFCLFDCSLVTDGAGAVIVTSADRAKDLRQPPVHILASASHNNLRGWFADDHMTRTAAAKSGQAAYTMAGIGPKDVDTAQLYDCFTYMVLVQLEDYGFCKKGEGGAFAKSGALELGGELPCNTSGGQLSEGHVEGMLQIVEAVRQLRHQYPRERQVKDARVALVSGHGGNTVCHSTLILGRADR
ncbi:MAG TPA: thiolase family protein [Tepidisphaeraceae bacterium]|jgi:acetyl-CoA acetyltransferase